MLLGATRALFDTGVYSDVLMVSGLASDYRLMAVGDDFILKGIEGGDRLTGIEAIRFSDGRVLELNRMYGPDFSALRDIPAHLLSGGIDGGPLVLPGADAGKFDDGPLILPGPGDFDDLPQVLPGPEDATPPHLALEARLALAGGWMATLDEQGRLTGEPAHRLDPDWM